MNTDRNTPATTSSNKQEIKLLVWKKKRATTNYLNKKFYFNDN